MKTVKFKFPRLVFKATFIYILIFGVQISFSYAHNLIKSKHYLNINEGKCILCSENKIVTPTTPFSSDDFQGSAGIEILSLLAPETPGEADFSDSDSVTGSGFNTTVTLFSGKTEPEINELNQIRDLSFLAPDITCEADFE